MGNGFFQGLREQLEKGGDHPAKCAGSSPPLQWLRGWGDLRLLGLLVYISPRGQFLPLEFFFAETLAVHHQRGLSGSGWGCLEFLGSSSEPWQACYWPF